MDITSTIEDLECKTAAMPEDRMVISYKINIHLPHNPANVPLGIL